MLLAVVSVIIGLIVLVWSAEKFVSGASQVASHYGMSPLLIGMLIVGFGTSAPEMLVSAISSLEGNPGIALGNAYGSNITNIALILGITALVAPIHVRSSILKRELPILTFVSLVAAFLCYDLELSGADAVVHIGLFALLMIWSIYNGKKEGKDSLDKELSKEIQENAIPLPKAYLNLIFGLGLLLASSRALVWGAVEIANMWGVDDIIVGLTVVAVGTSLPELASSIVAARKGEPDIAIGNVIGSNLFNTLCVVGISAGIKPFSFGQEVFDRDISFMLLLTVAIFAFGYGRKKEGIISRPDGAVLLFVYIGYTTYLVLSHA